MKTNATIKGFNPFQVLKKNHPFKTCLSIILAVAVVNLSVSCSYYKVKDLTTSQEDINKNLDEFNNSDRYAILHTGENVYHLNSIKVDKENNTLIGTVDYRNSKHQYKKPRKKTANRYKKKDQDPLSEIHIELNKNISPTYGSEIIIPFTDINSISINKEDNLAAFATFMLGTAAVIGGIFLIILATKSSCPFVYVKTGDSFQFIGELYPGVLTENMQRDDYIKLGEYDTLTEQYSIKVTNELKEIQHTDLLELMVVNHTNTTEVLLDNTGNVQTINNLQQPQQVLIPNLENNTFPLSKKDGEFYAFNSTSDWGDNKRAVILEYDRPETQEDTKLYITAKNSMWLDYIFGKFNEKFGSFYNDFQEQQQSKSKAQSEAWINKQEIPLSVYIETAKGWELIERINTVGPLAYRDIVVPIDAKLMNTKKLKIKLETGFMFWEVDYVGVDFTKNRPVEVNYVSPHEAIDQDGNLVTKLLKNNDKVYLTQSTIGDEVTVNFDLKNVILSDTYSVFLKNRGFYTYIRDYKGKPNLESLKVFREDGSFTEFSKFEYYNIMGIPVSDYLASNE